MAKQWLSNNNRANDDNKIHKKSIKPELSSASRQCAVLLLQFYLSFGEPAKLQHSNSFHNIKCKAFKSLN